jgi:hypothetical protein
LFLANAKSNSAIGLQRALEVLVDILEMLVAHNLQDTVGDSRTVCIDLVDLAKFASSVRSTRMFMAVTGHSKFAAVGRGELQLVVSAEIWQKVSQTNFQDDPLNQISTNVRAMERKVRAIEGALETMSTNMELQQEALEGFGSFPGYHFGRRSHREAQPDSSSETQFETAPMPLVKRSPSKESTSFCSSGILKRGSKAKADTPTASITLEL